MKNNSNIIPQVNNIVINMPDNLSDLEKVRYIYINLGKILSYDFRIMRDLSIADKKLDYSSSTMNNYQTCSQISEILALLLNNITANCTAIVVKRGMKGRVSLMNHVAVEVKFNNNKKYLLDLTLDLYLIQSGMRTKEFGNNKLNSDYDSISPKECEEIDKKIGYITNSYTDKFILDIKKAISQHNFEGMTDREILEYKINIIKEKLLKKFKGSFEAMRYIINVFLIVLDNEELSSLKQYNLSYNNFGKLELLNIFEFKGYDLIYSYSNNLKLENTNLDDIKNLINNGWETNSNTLKNMLNNSNKRSK